MDSSQFERLVREGLAALPPQIREKLSNVALVIEDEPSKDQREDAGLRDNETLFGLYEGVPQTERGHEYAFVLPDKITIFKLPILEACFSAEEVQECVANTVWHELAHHFGMDENAVRERERDTGREA